MNRPQPDMEMSILPPEKRRWVRQATDEEVKLALREKDVKIYEVPFMGQAYAVSYTRLTIVRSGEYGGDTFDIYGGWVYPQIISLMADEQELIQLARNPMNKAFS